MANLTSDDQLFAEIVGTIFIQRHKGNLSDIQSEDLLAELFEIYMQRYTYSESRMDEEFDTFLMKQLGPQLDAARVFAVTVPIVEAGTELHNGHRDRAIDYLRASAEADSHRY
jgi:hypothetical protein